MDKSTYSRAKQLVLELIDLSPEKRAGVLDRRCFDAPELRKLVESLIAHAESELGILGEMSAVKLWEILPRSLEELVEVDPPESIPQRIGSYEIIGIIGQGGMGVVYRAQQVTPVVREVAIKVIRECRDSSSVIDRFKAERQTIAALGHPNIVTMLDAGEDELGRPYFVMEVVDGVPLVKCCNDRSLNARERIALFIEVCRAIEHAHQRGVVHRDLKPSNILVEEVQGRLVPKVIDFGISSALDPESEPVTESESLFGTAEYMSPERLSRKPGLPDSRADIYSLGVILFELLSTTLPHEARDLGPSETMRILSQETRREFVRSVEWGRGLGDDIEAILDLSLHPDRDQRYQAVSSLGEDLERYLSFHPVMARDHTATYVIKKFALRHRMISTFTLMFLLLLAAFGVTMSVLYKEQVQLRGFAETQQRKSDSVNEFLQNMLAAVAPEDRGPEVTVREMLDDASSDVLSGVVAEPEVEQGILRTLGSSYLALGMSEQAEELYRRALDSQLNTNGAISDEALSLTRGMVQILSDRHAYDEAESLIVGLMEIHGRESDSLELATDLTSLAQIRTAQGDHPESERLIRAAIGIQEREFAGDNERLAEALHALAYPLYRQRRREEALEASKAGLAMRRRLFGEEHPRVLDSLHDVAFLMRATGDSQGAAEIYLRVIDVGGRVLGEKHPELGLALDNLARIYLDLGRYGEAAAYYRREMEIYEVHYAQLHPKKALVRSNYANCLLALSEYDEAERLSSESVDQWLELRGEQTPQRASCQLVLAKIQTVRGKFEEAEQSINDARSYFEAQQGPKSGRTLLALDGLAGLRLEQRRFEEAKEVAEFVLDNQRGNSVPKPLLIRALSGVARADRGMQDFASAEAGFRESLEICLDKWGEDHPTTARLRAELAEVLLGQGRLDESEELVQQAIGTSESMLGSEHPQLGWQLNILGEVLMQRGEPRLAQGLFTRALAIQTTRLPAESWRLARTRENLELARE